MGFRGRLLRTLRAVAPVLEVPGVLVIGSEVPNLLQHGAASTLVVSQDVDLAIPITVHGAVKARLGRVEDLRPSPQEPSVWLPATPALIEVNFVGMDPAIADAAESYVLPDLELPLMVFGALSFMRPAEPIAVEGLSVPVPRTAGLLLEKLLTERGGTKGDRDLLVVLGLMRVASEEDRVELVDHYRRLPASLRHAVRSNLTVLSLMAPVAGMPDPTQGRATVAAWLAALDRAEAEHE